ncbi:hypothetical protein SAMN04487897_11578 [Paenibacillus sp. yr247]|nr:hypothetical protein SAMN04487897_11578 [Paenibacillus sp. yr247]
MFAGRRSEVMFYYSFYVKVMGNKDNQGADCHGWHVPFFIEVGVKSWMPLS